MMQKIIAGALVVVGIAMLCVSFYIKHEIAEGRLQIADAERTVGKAKSLFSLSPVTQPIGEGISRSADRKIRSAHEEIAHYSRIAEGLLWGGVIAIIAGGTLFFVRMRR